MSAVILPSTPRIPLWIKLAYTAFMAVLIPLYWHYYGPTNFLYFCDVALILILIGIWIESPLLVSMCAVAIMVSQARRRDDRTISATPIYCHPGRAKREPDPSLSLHMWRVGSRLGPSGRPG